MNHLFKNIFGILRYTLTSVFCVLAFLVFILFFKVSFGPAVLATFILGGLLFSVTGLKKQSKSTDKKATIDESLHRLTEDKETFYKEAGMSKEETQFFRETMNTAKNQILVLEQNLKQVSKLKAIESRNNTIHLTQALFKDITNEPRRLHEVDKFLYVHLPSLVDLTEKYNEINNHEIKNKTTFETLEKSASTIDEMCQLIAVDYAAFKADDLAEMDLEIELAKQAIERDNEEQEEQ